MTMAYHRISRITEKPISDLRSKTGTESGASIDFLGVVRETEGGNPISGILYSCYEEMAKETLATIVKDGAARFPESHGVEIIHRVGFVAAGVPSLLIHVHSKHSALAIEALSFYLGEVKRLAPVWKEAQFTNNHE